MVTLGFLATLSGAVLGPRYRVLVLVPAIICASTLVFAAATAGAMQMSATPLALAIGVVGLQTGYLVGLVTGCTLAAARFALPCRPGG